MIESFSPHELTMLRQELQNSTLDVRSSTELLQIFLAGRGFGVSADAARDAGIRLGAGHCSLDAIQRELRSIAMYQ